MKIRGIVNRKVKDGVTMYKVKYKGEKEDGWLMANEVDAEMVAKFEAKRAGKMDKRSIDSAGGKLAKAAKSSASDDASSASASRSAASAPAPAPVPADLKPAVFNVMKAYLEKEPIESLTKKKVRRLLEQELGVPEMSLEARKPEIGAATDAYVAQQQEEEEEDDQQAGGDDTESESGADSSEEEEESEVKKERAPVKKPALTVQTKSGASAPKNVTKVQENAMKAKYFEANAETLTVDVLGNVLTGEPRSFASGNRGWHLSGKIEVMVGKKKLWAQLGLNLTISGSKKWS